MFSEYQTEGSSNPSNGNTATDTGKPSDTPTLALDLHDDAENTNADLKDLLRTIAARRRSNDTDPSSLQRSNPFVYNLIYLSVNWVKLSQIFLILFNRKFVAKGLAGILSGYNIANIPLPEDYGKISVCAPAMLEIPADLLSMALLASSLLGIDADDIARRYSENMEEGFMAALYEFFDEGNDHRLLKGMTTLFMLIHFAGLAWREIEPNFEQFEQEYPLALFILAPILFSANMCALIFLSSKDVYRGLNHLLNKHPVLLAPPQAYLVTLLKEGRWATAFQIFAESQAEHVTNAFLTSFLCSRIVQQFTWLPIPTSLTKWLGAMSGYYISMLIRGPVVYAKYNGGLKDPLAAVTAEQRNHMRDEKKIANPDRFLNELKCFFLGGLETFDVSSVTGYAQTILGAYLAYLLLEETQNTPLTLLMMSIGSLLSYLPYRFAQRELALNSEALRDINIRKTIFTHLETATANELLRMNDPTTREPDRDRLQYRLSRRHAYLKDQVSRCVQHDYAYDTEVISPPNALYPDEEIREKPLAKAARAATVVQDEKSPKPAAALPRKMLPEPTTSTGLIASCISGLAGIANATIGVSMFLYGSLKTSLPRRETLALASIANTAANVIDYRYKNSKITATLDNSVCFQGDDNSSVSRRRSCCSRLFDRTSSSATIRVESSAQHNRTSYGATLVEDT